MFDQVMRRSDWVCIYKMGRFTEERRAFLAELSERGYSASTLRHVNRLLLPAAARLNVRQATEITQAQIVCLRLMGKKLLVALAMEGKFASEGLQALDGDDDMLTAMARELVQNRGIGESADLLWKRVGEFLPSAGSTSEAEQIPESGTTDLFDSSMTAEINSTLPAIDSNSTSCLALQLSLF